MVSTWKWGPGFHPGMPKSALAGLMEAGSDVVATRSATIALCSETESGFGMKMRYLYDNEWKFVLILKIRAHGFEDGTAERKGEGAAGPTCPLLT